MRWLMTLGMILTAVSVQAQATEQPIRQRIGQRLKETAGVPVGQDFDSDGVKIHYTVEGEGEPVLLIHGYRANANMNWRAPGVTRMLAENYKVIAIDNRGHGESDKPEADGMYGTKMVEDCIRLLDHLKIAQAHWVGYSMGGMITMKALTMHPERVKSAIVGGMGWMEDRGLGNATAQANNAQDTTALRACLKGFRELTVSRGDLLAIKTPMTVIIGADDPIYERYVKPLQAARSDIPVVVVPEASHLTCIMQADFKSAITGFLTAQTGAK